MARRHLPMKNERMQARRYFKRGRMVPFKLVGRLVACRDADHADPERSMLRISLAKRGADRARLPLSCVLGETLRASARC